MTLDEVIKDMETVAEENQRIVDTGIVFEDVTIDMLYCDDTEVIDEHLANYQKVAEKYRQIADWLKELKQLKEHTTWIPVSERLPEDRNTVLVTAYWHETYQVMQAVYFGNDEWWCVPFNNCGEHMQRLKPKAWMPLPKPYEPQESDDMGDYPDTIHNQFDNMTGSMNL